MCLGASVRAHGRSGDHGACHVDTISRVGLGVGVEHCRRGGCEFAGHREVSSSLCAKLISDFSSPPRAPFIQKSSRNTTIFVWVTLVVSFVAYARFVSLVIYEITNYLGIACFRVMKKDADGVWKDATPHTKRS
jgi:hypothetical protein